MRPLQLPGATEGGEREREEQEADDDRQGDEPVGRVARPGAQGRVEPAERENGKCRADHFVEQLPQNAPEAAEAARLDR